MRQTYSIQFINYISSGNSIKNEIWNLLKSCDQEFVPSLSSREPTSDKAISKKDNGKDGLTIYFDKMIIQKFILIREYSSRELVGFLSFKNFYLNTELRNPSPSNYITTVCVKKEFRGNGIAKKMYSFVEHQLPSEYAMPTIMTRTWSTNSHISLLYAMGFELLETIVNQRGEGINTDYFVKNLKAGSLKSSRVMEQGI